MGTRDVETNPQKGWTRFQVSFQMADIAGNQSAARLRNPLQSGKIAIIEKIFIPQVVAAQSQILVGTIATDLGSLADIIGNLDNPGGPASVMVPSHQNNQVSPPALNNPELLSQPS